jgi:hypothetical protein
MSGTGWSSGQYVWNRLVRWPVSRTGWSGGQYLGQAGQVASI